MLEQVEVWSPLIVEGDDFTIDDSVLGEVAKDLGDVRVLSVKRFLVF
jgi:hypothetical protein